MKLLVSACLLGADCKYSGGNNLCPALLELASSGLHTLVPVCPEIYGGLPTPREPAERRGERVVTKGDTDVTAEYCRGAQQALALAQTFGCEGAVLKANSPSCGCGQIYDGSFSGRLVAGSGVTAELLRKNGIPVVDEHHLEQLLGGKEPG